MNTTVCPECGSELFLGDYPFCPHGSIFRQNAQHFDPILAWRLDDGSHISTGSNDINVVPPGGGTPVWIDTLRKADALVRDVNRKEQEEIDIRTEQRRNHAEKAQRESRAQLRAELEKRSISARNIDAILADRDGRGPGKAEYMRQAEAVANATGQPFNRDHAERIFEQTERTRRNPDYRGRPQATFGIEVFEKDASNREAYRDERTGWRGRKG